MLAPLAASKWNDTTAAHLLNRAGFGGPPQEIEKLVALGPEPAVAWFVDYEKIPDPTADPEWAKPDPTRREKFETPARRTRRNAGGCCDRSNNGSDRR